MFMIVWLHGICKSKMASFKSYINKIAMNLAAECNLIRNQEDGGTGEGMAIFHVTIHTFVFAMAEQHEDTRH